MIDALIKAGHTVVFQKPTVPKKRHANFGITHDSVPWTEPSATRRKLWELIDNDKGFQRIWQGYGGTKILDMPCWNLPEPLLLEWNGK